MQTDIAIALAELIEDLKDRMYNEEAPNLSTIALVASLYTACQNQIAELEDE